MELFVRIEDSEYKVHREKPLDISIHMDFEGKQPNSYKVPKAISKPYKDESFIGDVRLGGSCNFETITLTPHCNGTHTESVGHITEKRIYLTDVLDENLIPASLISVPYLKGADSEDTYDPSVNDNDNIITRELLEKQLLKSKPDFSGALIIRTLPNLEDKRYYDYSEFNPPYLSNEAMELIKKLGFRHLLIDTPSVDRLFDEGKLTNHHIFWGVPKGSSFVGDTIPNKTITEFIYVDNNIEDGSYLLDLRVPAIKSDAVPSRPVLYLLEKIEK